MLEFAKALHDAIGISSPRVFVLVCALVGAVLFGGIGWLVDIGYRAKLRQEVHAAQQTPQTEARVQQQSSGANSPTTAVIGNNNTVTVNPSGAPAILPDPVLVIEPEDSMIHSKEDCRFQFYLYNAGTSDIEAIEIYEDYYGVTGWGPLRVEILGPVIGKANTTLNSLRTKARMLFFVDDKNAWPSMREGTYHAAIAMIRLHYRRSSDGARFRMGKVMWMTGSKKLLLADSERVMGDPPPGFPKPASLREIGQALGGTDQKRED
jgi:hypothetical protein